MKKMLTSLKTIFFVMIASTAFGQTISNIVVNPSAPNDCSNTAVTVDATQLCINYIYNGISHSINGSNIDVTLDWQTPGPICLGALAFVQSTAQLGQVAPGTYTLNIKTLLDGVVQQTQSQQLTVTSCCPVSSSVSQTNASICVGQGTTVTGTPAGATSTYWSLNGNVVTSLNTLAAQPTTPGTYTYYYVATDGSCADSTAFTLIVNDYPNINLGNDTTICDNQALVLNASSGTFGSTYLWNTGATGVNNTVNAAGTYSVVVSNSGCLGGDTIVVSTLNAPTLNLGNDTTLCGNSTLTLDATATTNNLTYLWSDGSINPTLNVNTAGNYQVTVTNGVGCSATDNITVGYQANPIPNLGNDTILCPGESIVLDATTSPVGFINWSGGSGDPTLTVTSEGTYYVTITTSVGCTGSDSVTINYSDISVDFGSDTLDLFNGNPLTLDAGNPGATYLWNTGDGTQTISVNTPGTFDVTVTDLYGCSASGSVVVINTTSTNSLVDNTFKVYPNPAQHYIVIEADRTTITTTQLINVAGQLIQTVNMQNQTRINVEDLAQGIYFLQFRNENGEILGQTKFIKQ